MILLCNPFLVVGRVDAHFFGGGIIAQLMKNESCYIAVNALTVAKSKSWASSLNRNWFPGIVEAKKQEANSRSFYEYASAKFGFDWKT